MPIIAQSLSQSNQTTARNKEHPDCKGEIQIVPVYTWHNLKNKYTQRHQQVVLRTNSKSPISFWLQSQYSEIRSAITQ